MRNETNLPPGARTRSSQPRIPPTHHINHHKDDEDDDDDNHDDHGEEFLRNETNLPPGVRARSSQPRIPPTLNTNHHNDDDGDDSGDNNDDGDDDDEAIAEEQPGRARWRKQINHLILRKTLYKLGNRGTLSILERAYFYIQRLKVLINLPADEREKVRQALRNRLETSSKSFSPYCGDPLCSPRMGKCGNHLSLQIPNFSLTDKKVKIEKHFLFSGPVKGKHSLGDYESVLASEFIPPKSFFEDFAYHPSIRIKLFDQMCCLFTLKVNIKGFQVQTLNRSNGPLYIARGRKQRCYLTSTISEPRFRIIDPKSAFFKLCLTAAHAASLGKSPQETQAFFLGLNLITPSLTRHIRSYTSECLSCRLNHAFEARKNYLMQSLEPSPTGKLISIAKAKSSFSQVCVDLSGQYFYLSNNRQRQGIYFLMCVSSHFCGETRIIPVRDKTVQSILLGLKTLAYGSSSKLEVCLFDAGTEYLRYVTKTSPMEQTTNKEPLSERWFMSLFKNSIQTDLEQYGIFIQHGKARHSAINIAENKIREMKRVFKSFQIFRKSEFPIDIFQIHLILSIVHYILETRPVCIVGTQVYSLQDFRSLFLKGGKLTNSECGIPLKSKEVVQEHERLHSLYNQVTTSLLAHHIPSLLSTHHPRESYKQSISVGQLRPNDVIWDSVGFKETGSISGNLGRVLEKSESQRFCLIQKCIQKDGKLRQICVSRPCEYISFICHGNEENIIFEPQYNLFSFNECLQQSQKAETIYNIPSRNNATKPQIQPNATKPQIQPNAIEPQVQPQATEPQIQPSQRFSKRGRLLKPPKKW